MRSKSDVGGWILSGTAKTRAYYLRRRATRVPGVFFLPLHALALVDLLRNLYISPVAVLYLFGLALSHPMSGQILLYRIFQNK